MTKELVHINLPKLKTSNQHLGKNNWLAILNATRVPPHIGMLIDGNYNSLTIKGQEFNISHEVLLKTIAQKKIESTFIKIKPHPVFSNYYQLEILQEAIKKFVKVENNTSTCLSPIKLFFQELYALQLDEKELLFEFVERLCENNFITDFMQFNQQEENDTLLLPYYTKETLQQKILEANNWQSTL